MPISTLRLVLCSLVLFPALLSGQITHTVTNTNDSGNGSLRDTVSSATSGDTIQFSQLLDGQTITLGGNEISITSNLIIDASSLPSGLTISAGNLSRIFHVMAAADARLEGITLRDGTAGDGGGVAVRAGARLEVVDCIVSNHTASVSGGCFYNEGTLAVRRSALSFGNSPTGAGVFSAGGILTVEASSIVRNTAMFSPALEAHHTQVILTNSTVADNSATGPGDKRHITLLFSSLDVSHCTLTKPLSQGVDIMRSFNTLTASIVNSLVSTSQPLEIVIQPAGTLIRNDANFAASDLALFLYPLDSYVGFTETQPPIPGTFADLGIATALVTDQHGLARAVGPAPDLGAVELQDTSTVTSNSDTGAGSLRSGIKLVRPGGQIVFDTSLDGNTITLDNLSGPIAVDHEVTLNASALPSGLTISGDGRTKLFQVNPTGTLILNFLNITLGSTNQNGGAIFNEGTLHLKHCTINQCLALVHGGAVFNSRGIVTIENSTIASNFAGRTGGGISGNEGMLVVRHSTITDNEAIFNDGGGIKIFNDGPLTLENSIVAGNEAFLGPDNLADGVLTELGNNLLSGDPRLAPLANYGGPTLTRPPLPGSPALEGAILLGSTPPSDQIGNVRPSGPLPDLGSVEAVAVLPALAPLTDSEPDGIPDLLEGPGGAYPHLDPTVDDSTLDTDGDGSLDAEEIANMSDPLDGNDRFRIVRIGPGPGFHAQLNPLVEVTISTFPGLSYSFQSDQLLQNFQIIPGSSFVADDFEETVQVLLSPDRDFVQGRRE